MIGSVRARLYSRLEITQRSKLLIQSLILSYWENCSLLMSGDKAEQSSGRTVGSTQVRVEKTHLYEWKADHWTQVCDEPGSLRGVRLWSLHFASESNSCYVIESCSRISGISQALVWNSQIWRKKKTLQLMLIVYRITLYRFSPIKFIAH